MKIRKIESVEIAAAGAFIKKVFDEFVAAEYSEDGVEYFYKITSEESIRERFANGNPIYVAANEERIAGYIEMINSNHIYLLFIGKEFQKDGIAGSLIKYSLKFIAGNNPDLSEVTVNSTSSALTFYEKMGFFKMADFQLKNGILSFPMSFKLR